MIDTILKFSQLQFNEGWIAINRGVPFIASILLFVLAAGAIVYLYFVRNRALRHRIPVVLLRILILFLLLIPLVEPSLVTPDVIPNENFLAVLVDRSASMGIADGHFGSRRIDDAAYLLNNDENGILNGLDENFKVRYYSFGSTVARSDSLDSRNPVDQKTEFLPAINRVISDFKGLPLTGIVMLTDGGDNTTDDPISSAVELNASGIPLHIVGLGTEKFDSERELLDVASTKGVQKGSGAELDIKVRSWSEELEEVSFNLYRGEENVYSDKRTLKGGGRIDYFSLFYEPEGAEGAEVYTMELEPAGNEVNSDNNQLNLLIDSGSDTVRVLYIEGHPRNDYKFIKRSLEDDSVVEITSVLRTGSNKFYRQGLKESNELQAGFPVNEDELYRYKAVIFGDVEASFFSIEQLRMVEKFVRERGGGFLMLGGTSSFAEGDYYRTPIADLLPVDIDPGRKQAIPKEFHNPRKSSAEQGFRFVPTREGFDNPLLKLASDISLNRSRWSDMPTMTSINYLGAIKPGATLLAQKPEDDFGGNEPLFVIQRYGRGRSAALATSSSWRWQMQNPSDDVRHERFWRQLARWLVTEAPDNVTITMNGNLFAPDESIQLRATIFNDDFEPLEFAGITARITAESGRNFDVDFNPLLGDDGEYQALFVPSDEGIYKLEVSAKHNNSHIGENSVSFLVRNSKREFYNAPLQKRFLTDLAEASGGKYYEPEFAASEIIPYLKTKQSATSIQISEYLWDMPLLYLILLILFVIEWIYRRQKGMP